MSYQSGYSGIDGYPAVGGPPRPMYGGGAGSMYGGGVGSSYGAAGYPGGVGGGGYGTGAGYAGQRFGGQRFGGSRTGMGGYGAGMNGYGGGYGTGSNYGPGMYSGTGYGYGGLQDDAGSYYGGGYGRDSLGMDTMSMAGSRYAGSMGGMPGMGAGMGRRSWPYGQRFNKYNPAMGAPGAGMYGNDNEVIIQVNARIDGDRNLILPMDVPVSVPMSVTAMDVWRYAIGQSIELARGGWKPTGNVQLTAETMRGIESARDVSLAEIVGNAYNPGLNLWVFTVMPGVGGMGIAGSGMGYDPRMGRPGSMYGGVGTMQGGSWGSMLGSAASGMFGGRYGGGYNSGRYGGGYGGGMNGYNSAGGYSAPMAGRMGLPRSRSLGAMPVLGGEDMYGGGYGGYGGGMRPGAWDRELSAYNMI